MATKNKSEVTKEPSEMMQRINKINKEYYARKAKRKKEEEKAEAERIKGTIVCPCCEGAGRVPESQAAGR